jgi:hypothetical protein
MHVPDASLAYAGAAALLVPDAALATAGEVSSHVLEALPRETEALLVHQGEGLHFLALPQEALKHLCNRTHVNKHINAHALVKYKSCVHLVPPQMYARSANSHHTAYIKKLRSL